MNGWCRSTILAWVVGLALPAQGQVPPAPRFSLTVAPVAGIASLAGNRTNEFDPSVCFGGEADLRISGLLAVTAAVVYNEFSPRFVSASVRRKATFLEFGAGGKYILTSAPVAKPYIRAGVAFYRRDSGGSRTGTDLGLNGGAGADFDLPGSRLGFTAAARFHNIFVAGSAWKYFDVYGGVRISLI